MESPGSKTYPSAVKYQLFFSAEEPLSNLFQDGGLLVASFLAGTILPGSSEAVLVSLLVLNPESATRFLVVATLGNTLGSLVNWAIGNYSGRYLLSNWKPLKSKRIARAYELMRRYGCWALLLSWFPFVGDALTLAAGLLRVPIVVFICIVAFGKFLRYFLVTQITLAVLPSG